MSSYTNALTAEQLISFIATDYVELSHDRVRNQRDNYIKICREWLSKNVDSKDFESDINREVKDDF